MDLHTCRLCPNECGVDRTSSHGKCHAGAEARICRVALHHWEEPIISGTRGSGTIFFSGCSLGCVFCQNYEISHFSVGRPYTTKELIDAIQHLEAAGAHNINFVNPTHYAHVLYTALMQYRPSVPVIYNTGGYDKVETLQMLNGLIDIYLPDLKYLTPNLAKRYSGQENYPTVACAALDEMFRQAGPAKVTGNLMQRGMIVRHMMLPGQSDEGVRVAEYLANRYGNAIYISAMSQYTPHGQMDKYPEINRRLKPIEYKRMVATLSRLGITNCFTQDIGSSDDRYIPPFEK